MGFHKISAQESSKSIISNQSIESSATYTCTCGGGTGRDDKSTGNNVEGKNENGIEENLMENSCFHKRNIMQVHHRKMVQQIFLFILGALAFIPCGASIAWSSKFLFQHWNDAEFLSTSTSWIVASLPLTAAFTSLIVFKLVHKGVHKLLLSSTIIMALSWLLILLRSHHVSIIFLGRVLGGVGVGAIYIIIPKYLQDLTLASQNKLVENVMYAACLIGALFQYASSDYTDDDNLATISMIIISIISTIGFTFYPESPHSLLRGQRYVDARNVLQNFLTNDDEIISKMQNWTICEQRGDESFAIMFKSRSWVERLVPVFGLVIFDALLGVTALMFYLKPIVMGVGESVLPVTIQTIIISLGMLLGIFLKPVLFCKLNPKSSLLLSVVVIFLTYGLLGTYYHTTNLGISVLSDNYPCIPIICFTTLALTYTSGVTSNVRTYLHAVTVTHNRFAVQTTTHAISWLITSILCAELNHVIWYIGIGWLFYNMAIISVFMLCFIILLMPRLIKDVIVIDVVRDGSEVSSSGSSERSKTSMTDSTSTDVTMDNVLVV